MINIEERAADLLHKSQSFSYPIKLEQIAKFLNIELEEVELDADVSGFIVKDGISKVHIGYNKFNVRSRQRFTIAHEIAHYYLGHTEKNPFLIDSKQKSILFRNQDSSSGKILMEREANAFAAALLMPKVLIHNYINQEVQNSSDKDLLIQSLFEAFQVSKDAMTIRLVNLGIIEYDF